MGSAFSNSCTKSKQKKENNTNIITPAQQNRASDKQLQQQENNPIENEQTRETKFNTLKQDEAIIATAPNTSKTHEEKYNQNHKNEKSQEDTLSPTQQLSIDEEEFKKENSDGYFSRHEFIKVQQYLQEEKEQLKEQLEKENQQGKQKWIPGKTEDKILGKGSFGTVVLGHNKNTGEIVAVKLIETKDDRKQKYKAIIDEVKILKLMRHKNVVRYYGIQEHKAKDHIGIVCEFVSGGSLWRLIQRFGQFSEPLIKKYTTDILMGLQYLHYHGITHRDIKGANILVDSDGICKLADFGLAKSISHDLDEGQLKLPQGTPNWMAPEVCRQGSCNSRFSDIWSLGCTLYEMITGRPPYSNLLAETIILRVGLLRQPPQFLENLPISEKLSSFLLHCFQIKPEDRWNVDQLLMHPFITETDSFIDKNPPPIRKRNSSLKKTYKKNSQASSSTDNVVAQTHQQEPSTKHEQYISQKQPLSQNSQQSTPTQTFTVNVKNNQNKRDSLKTILEESNQQYTGQEENTETNIRMKSPSLFHEEYSFAENNLKDPSVQSFDPQKASAFFSGQGEQINGQSQNKLGGSREVIESQLYSTDSKLKNQKYKPVNSNAFLRDDAEDDQDNQQNNEELQLSHNINGLSDISSKQQQLMNNNNFNFNNNKIDEVEGEDDDENTESPQKIKKVSQSQSNGGMNQSVEGQNKIIQKKNVPSKSNIKTKATEDFEEEENEMLNSNCLRGIATERRNNEKIEVKHHNIPEYNISIQSKNKGLSQSVKSNQLNQFEFFMPNNDDFIDSSTASPQKK